MTKNIEVMTKILDRFVDWDLDDSEKDDLWNNFVALQLGIKKLKEENVKHKEEIKDLKAIFSESFLSLLNHTTILPHLELLK